MLRVDQPSVLQLGQQTVLGGPGGRDSFSRLLSVAEALGSVRGAVRIWTYSFNGTRTCWTVKRIFHGHFPTPKAVPLGGALEVDIIQTEDNPSGPDKP